MGIVDNRENKLYQIRSMDIVVSHTVHGHICYHLSGGIDFFADIKLCSFHSAKVCNLFAERKDIFLSSVYNLIVPGVICPVMPVGFVGIQIV